ncbi:MAG: outer membrane beta-barrel protein [Thiotrichaceae bacterium]
MPQRLYQFLFILLLSGPAFADSGFYVGGEVGYSWADNPSEVHDFTLQAESDAININTSLNVDDSLNSASKGLFVGYWIKDYLAIEVNYARVVDGAINYDFDKAGHLGFSADIDRLSLSLLPFYKLNERFDIYGRIGYAESSAKIETGGAITTTDIDYDDYAIGDDDSAGALAGIGVRFHNEHYYVRVEGQYDDSLYGLRGIMMGFGYQF